MAVWWQQGFVETASHFVETLLGVGPHLDSLRKRRQWKRWWMKTWTMKHLECGSRRNRDRRPKYLFAHADLHNGIADECFMQIFVFLLLEALDVLPGCLNKLSVDTPQKGGAGTEEVVRISASAATAAHAPASKCTWYPGTLSEWRPVPKVLKVWFLSHHAEKGPGSCSLPVDLTGTLRSSASALPLLPGCSAPRLSACSPSAPGSPDQTAYSSSLSGKRREQSVCPHRYSNSHMDSWCRTTPDEHLTITDCVMCLSWEHYPSDQLFFLLLFIGQVLRRQLQLILDQLMLPTHCPDGTRRQVLHDAADVGHHSDLGLNTRDSLPHGVGVEQIFFQLVCVVLLFLQNVIYWCGISTSCIQGEKRCEITEIAVPFLLERMTLTCPCGVQRSAVRLPSLSLLRSTHWWQRRSKRSYTSWLNKLH